MWGRYIGIDISRPSLEVALKALSDLPWPINLRCQDCVEAINTWDEPVDVVWFGQSLHHIPRPSEKQDFMRRVRALLPRNGLFLIWEPTCFDGEDREGWFERFCGCALNGRGCGPDYDHRDIDAESDMFDVPRGRPPRQVALFAFIQGAQEVWREVEPHI